VIAIAVAIRSTLVRQIVDTLLEEISHSTGIFLAFVARRVERRQRLDLKKIPDGPIDRTRWMGSPVFGHRIEYGARPNRGHTAGKQNEPSTTLGHADFPEVENAAANRVSGLLQRHCGKLNDTGLIPLNGHDVLDDDELWLQNLCRASHRKVKPIFWVISTRVIVQIGVPLTGRSSQKNGHGCRLLLQSAALTQSGFRQGRRQKASLHLRS
jgi:hypothetical protein